MNNSYNIYKTLQTNGLKALFFTVFILSNSVSFGHHYKGLPHYGYFDNYPQAPVLEFIGETPEYEAYLTVYNFQGLDLAAVDAPNDVRFYIYIYDIAREESYHGKAHFEIFSHGKKVAEKFDAEQEEESIYVLRKQIIDQDDLLLKITLPNGPTKDYFLEMPIQITDSFLDKYGMFIGIFLFFVVVGVIKKFSDKEA